MLTVVGVVVVVMVLPGSVIVVEIVLLDVSCVALASGVGVAGGREGGRD